jgi:hypothetical protein
MGSLGTEVPAKPSLCVGFAGTVIPPGFATNLLHLGYYSVAVEPPALNSLDKFVPLWPSITKNRAVGRLCIPQEYCLIPEGYANTAAPVAETCYAPWRLVWTCRTCSFHYTESSFGMLFDARRRYGEVARSCTSLILVIKTCESRGESATSRRLSRTSRYRSTAAC